MRIVELTKKEYQELSLNNPMLTFYQTANWGKIKESTGWTWLLLGYLDDNNTYKAFGNFLLRKAPIINSYLAYCPRGFIIDFNNKELLDEFNKDLCEYLKKKNCFELIIDPYLISQERDINGDVVEDGIDNREVVEHLKQLGYKHNGYNLYYENLQPRWLFRLNIDKDYEELEKEFKNEAKRRSKKKEFFSINTRELNKDEIPLFKQLMEKTADRIEFNDRSLSYYQKMYDNLHDDGILSYMVCEINCNKARENILNEIKIIEDRISKLKKPGRIKEEEVTLNSLKTLLIELDKCQKELGDIAPLSVVCMMKTGNEAIMLLAGNDEEYLQHFNSSNIIITDLIKQAQKENYKYFNFYGITGDFNKDNPHYGLYLYKRQYGGEVVELIGQFEITLNKTIKRLYDLAMAIRRKLR